MTLTFSLVVLFTTAQGQLSPDNYVKLVFFMQSLVTLTEYEHEKLICSAELESYQIMDLVRLKSKKCMPAFSLLGQVYMPQLALSYISTKTI